MAIRHQDPHPTHKDEETAIWIMIVLLLAASAYAMIELFAKVAE